MYSLERFADSGWSLVIRYEGKIIFRSRASGLKALQRYLKQSGQGRQGVEIYDTHIGRAAGLLMVLARPSQVFTNVISDGGREVMERHNLIFEATKQVKYLMGIASEGTCRWERLAIGKSPEEFLELLRGSTN